MFVTLGCKFHLVSPLDGRAVYIFLCDFLEPLGLLTLKFYNFLESLGILEILEHCLMSHICILCDICQLYLGIMNFYLLSDASA